MFCPLHGLPEVSWLISLGRDLQDSTFVYASYAAVFLLKLVSPTFAAFIDEAVAMRLVRELADVLEEAAVDEQHTPALCAFPTRAPLKPQPCLTIGFPRATDASFLRMLIDNKLNGPRTAANSRAGTRPGSPAPGTFGIANPYTAHADTVDGASTLAAGLESLAHSRAASAGPEGLGDFSVSNTGLPPAELGNISFGLGMGNEFANGVADGASAFDSLVVDDVLSANGFWSSMLMVRSLSVR